MCGSYATPSAPTPLVEYDIVVPNVTLEETEAQSIADAFTVLSGLTANVVPRTVEG